MQIKGRPADENHKDETSSPTYPTEPSSDKENNIEVVSVEAMDEKPLAVVTDEPAIALHQQDEMMQGDSSDEGWQEAVPKGRSPSSRKSTSSRRPSLVKLNPNSMNNSDSIRYRGRASNFPSPRMSPTDTAAPTTTVSVPKKLVRHSSFNVKLAAPASSPNSTEKSASAKSAPSSPAVASNPVKLAPLTSSTGTQSSGKLLSYKEVALAPPGTVVKATVGENNPDEKTHQVRKEATAAEPNQGEQAAVNEEVKDVENPSGGEPGALPTSQEIKNLVVDEKEAESADAVIEKSSQVISSIVIEEKETKGKEEDTKTEFKSNDSPAESNSNAVSSESDKTEPRASSEKECQAASTGDEPQPVLTEETPPLPEKDSGIVENKVVEQGDKSVKDLPTGNENEKIAEKYEAVEAGKETSKKLSAEAPPFSPSMVPVFGSVTMPGFKDHGGILPPPVHIPIRKSHQSATSRVPYGPRLSGGYNRSGNRASRSKHNLHNGEPAVDVNLFSAVTVMNPHAAEFVPGQPWLPNGYPVSPNGYPVSPTGYQVSPNGFLPSTNGFPFSPSGYPASPDSIPVSPNGFPASPNSLVASPMPVVSEVSETQAKGEANGAENIENPSVEEKQESQMQPEEQLVDTEETPPKDEQNPTAEVATSEDLPVEKEECDDQKIESEALPVEKEECDDKKIESEDLPVEKGECDDQKIEQKPAKRWGDYSDSEAELVDVKS